MRSQAEGVRLARLEDIPNRGTKRVTAEGRELLLCRLDGLVFVLPSRCTHRGAPLADGHMEGPFLRCPWHGVRFDVRTGVRVCAPDCEDLRVARAQVRGDAVWLPAPAG